MFYVNKNGMALPVPNVKTWCGLDEFYMDRIYEKVKKVEKITYYDLVVVSWSHKSQTESFKERQAILALENLGLVKQTNSFDEEWITTRLQIKVKQ